MLSPEQSRAARGWLDWTQAELATRASVGLSTVKDFEAGRRTPIGNNLAAIERALTDAGIGLENPKGVTYSGDAPSVAIKPESPGSAPARRAGTGGAKRRGTRSRSSSR